MADITDTIIKSDHGQSILMSSSRPSLNDVPLWHKLTLTIDEANALSGIGIGKLRELANNDDCPFILWNGTKYLFKREELETYLEEHYSI